MEFVFGFRLSRSKFRVSFLTFTPISIVSPPRSSDIQTRSLTSQQEISDRRRRVLIRDRYRFRGCDRDEREVVVAVHLVNPNAERERDMLTLCRCFEIVSKTEIVASHTSNSFSSFGAPCILTRPTSRICEKESV